MKLIIKLIFPLYIVFLFAVARPQSDSIGEDTLKVESKKPVELRIGQVKFCGDVVEKEPVAVDTVFSSDVGKVYFWSRIFGPGNDVSIFHVWNYKGRQESKVPMTVDGGGYRAFSFQSIGQNQTGRWTVYVIDEDNNVLAKSTFRIKPKEKLSVDSE
jgi:hypothetical protein